MTGELTPTQQRHLDLLGCPPADRPPVDPSLADRLRTELEERLAPIARRVPEGQQLWLAKHQLSTVLGCEVRFLAEERERFEWSAAKARGTIVHKAIELSWGRRDSPTPVDLVDDAIGSLTEGGTSIAEFLQTSGETVIAELRVDCAARVTSFVEVWPPLKKEWRPVHNGAIRAHLADGCVVLSGKPDLTLGQGDSASAAKVIVDFKTGGAQRFHTDDLRFYALLDTLRLGVPPRLVATSYLDQGTLSVEPVTEPHLFAAADRVVDAAGRLVTLRAGERDPELRPGPPCRYCPVRPGCEPGQSFVAAATDDGLDPMA